MGSQSEIVADLFSVSQDAGVGLRRLDVVKAEYVGSESVTWEELFDGYDSLKAITFSSGVSFVCRLVERFDKAEIIFGCEEVMQGTIQDVMAYQAMMIERLRSGTEKIKELQQLWEEVLQESREALQDS